MGEAWRAIMIDFKRPLKGVFGLLLMTALIFFGATVGVAVALMMSWVEMKDSLANFLGGVVGACLGAALAIGGAVYVQGVERRDRLQGPLNVLAYRVRSAVRALKWLRGSFGKNEKEASYTWVRKRIHDAITTVERDIARLPDAAELSEELHERIQMLKENSALDLARRIAQLDIDDGYYDQMWDTADTQAELLQEELIELLLIARGQAIGEHDSFYLREVIEDVIAGKKGVPRSRDTKNLPGEPLSPFG